MDDATLGNVFEKYKLNAICNDCGRSKGLDVAALKDKYGDDFEVPRLSKMAKCTKCESPNGCRVRLGNIFDLGLRFHLLFFHLIYRIDQFLMD